MFFDGRGETLKVEAAGYSQVLKVSHTRKGRIHQAMLDLSLAQVDQDFAVERLTLRFPRCPGPGKFERELLPRVGLVPCAAITCELLDRQGMNGNPSLAIGVFWH